MGFFLRHSVQINAGVDRLAAARDALFEPPAQRRERRRLRRQRRTTRGVTRLRGRGRRASAGAGSSPAAADPVEFSGRRSGVMERTKPVHSARSASLK